MGQLRALQEELKKLLPIGWTQKRSQFWGDNFPARLQVYRNTVHGNCYDTLDSDFPLTQKQFCDHEWFDLSQEFFIKYPPQSWELNNCILSFPKFLKAKKVKSHVVELAEYELADLQAFIDAAEVKSEMGVTNPTVRVRVFQHQIYDWVSDGVPSEKPPKQKPEVLVFYRNTNHDCFIRKAEPLMLMIIDHFRKPGADLCDLEPLRRQLLPNNNVELQTVLDILINKDIILL